MEKNNFAVFIDLENTGGKVGTLTNVIEKVKLRGDILISKVYGYSERYSDLKETLLSNTFTVVPSLRWGISQKNNSDIQLVIDALEVAYRNDLIDCFCIVSGDSDYTPLVGRLKSMGKFVLGISRSEVASNIFINACNEFVFLESVTSPVNNPSQENGDSGLKELNALIEKAIAEQADAVGGLFASEVKKTVLRLRPDFAEKNYGYSSFGKLLSALETRYGGIKVIGDNYTLKVRLSSEPVIPTAQLTKANWMNIFQKYLDSLREEGFDRVNPSIIKQAVQKEYPDFDERQIGFKKFSDMMRQLEKKKKVELDFDEAMTMLVKIL